MASWPTHDDVCEVLRLQDPSVDDAVVESARLAAIDYCTNRVDPAYIGYDVTGAVFVSDSLFEAALLLSARLYRRRDSLDGTIGWGDMGVVRVGVKDNDVEALLAPSMAVVLG
jgi:hypothetical protein